MSLQLTVFVCGTYSDLSDEREAVLDSVRRLQLQHDSMEFFGARDGRPIETCLEEVRKSNILVVVVGHRYGTLVPELGISFSEAEYEEGVRLKKKCLVYMRDENVPVLPKHVERDPEKLRLLERWKATLQERHTVVTFRESRDLAVQVAADLSRTISELSEAAEAREQAHSERSAPFLAELGLLISDALGRGASEPALISAIRRTISTVLAEATRHQPTVFLSYAHQDKEIVRKVAAGLEKAGIRVWIDVSSIKAGENWVRAIERGLDSADYIVFFISPQSMRRGYVQKELQIALHRQVTGEGGAFILPILLKETPVSPLLRDIHWIDMTDGDVGEAVKGLVSAIRFKSLVKKFGVAQRDLSPNPGGPADG